MDTLITTPRSLRLQAEDDVVVAVDPIERGAETAGTIARARIGKGHKMAVRALGTGAPVRKFGQIIGFASSEIAPGDLVHEHNLVMHDFARDYHFAEDAHEDGLLPEVARATFEGFDRGNGRSGTRNYVAILTSVNCSASVARFIAQAAERSGLLAANSRTSTASFRWCMARAAASPPRARASRRLPARNGAMPATRISARC